ncbi:MAG: hypothetical protein ACRD2T_15990, partial [Thermoanaerobaculia bacterium]
VALCEECVQPTHRWFFCRRCGERAEPLAPAAPPVAVTVTRSHRPPPEAAGGPVGFANALGYPFRGLGAYLFWGYVALLAIFRGIQAVVPFGGFILWVPQAVIALLLPSLLFAVARTTSRGEDELPDWPDFDFWERLGDLLLFAAVAAFSLLPLALFFALSDCDPIAALFTATVAPCLPPLLGGLLVAVALWVPAFGATAVWSTPWLFFRLDLHARAVAVDPPLWLRAMLLIGGFLVVSQVLPLVLSAIPFLGVFLGDAVSFYGILMGAHLVGLIFRRHFQALEAVYLD